MISISFILIVAGLGFGGGVAVIGFGGLMIASFHRALGTPLPLPTIHNVFEKRLYTAVGLAGLLVWASAFFASLQVAP